MLWWLLRYPLQRVEDIALALQVSSNTIYRHLTRAIEEGLIEYITPSLSVKSTCRLYYLSNKGLLTAAEHEQTDAGTLARTWAADEKGLLRLLSRLSTLIHLQDLINGLVAHAPTMLAHEQDSHTHLAWHWQRDYQHRFLANDRHLNLQADAVFLLYHKASYQIIQGASKNDCYCALLFFDPGFVGHSNRALIAQKLETLLHYRSSAAWNANPELFPPVIVVTQTAHQREIWQHYACEVAMSAGVAPLHGAIIDLASPKASDSFWVLPWQKLSDPALCNLRDVFVPLPRRLLPPGLLQSQIPSGTVAASPAARTELILRGSFTSRVKEVDPTPGNSRQQEREEIALLRLCLSQRHLDVLHLIYAYPFLETKEMAMLLDLQADSVTRYLYELRRYAFIEKCSMGQAIRWYVSARGLRLIAASLNVSLHHLAEQGKGEMEGTLVQRGLQALKTRLSQTVSAYTFFAALHYHTRLQRGGHQVLWWEICPQYERRYPDLGTRYLLRPDATFAYKVDQGQLLAWLECIETTQRIQALATKMQTYAQFTGVQEQKHSSALIPQILLLVISQPLSYQRFLPIITEQLAGAGILVYTTTARDVSERGPLAAIWSEVLPAQPNADATALRTAKCSLLDLIVLSRRPASATLSPQ